MPQALKKILIVEDERLLAISLRMDLEEIGFRNIRMVTNFDDACDAFRTEEPELVLMDVSIHGEKNGIDTARFLSAISSVPVIFLTGETDSEIRKQAESCTNCRGYLTKPIRMEMLEPLLSQVLSSTFS